MRHLYEQWKRERAITGDAEGNGSMTEIENAQNGTTGVISYYRQMDRDSTVNAVNNGSIWSIALGDSGIVKRDKLKPRAYD